MPTLDWIGKQAVINHHREVLTRLLHCDSDLSAGDPDAGNLLVEGDNLKALKALLPYYAGQVKCIYIDPPYNTGNEGWVYNDNVNSPEILAWLLQTVGKEGEDLSRHDKWLCMMYPRLRLLRDFLTRDGSIAISIDENELSSLLFLMDEIFGRQNRAGTMVWQKGKKGDAKLLPVIHEYIVLYARDKARLTANEVKWRRRKAGADEVLEHYAELRDELSDDHAAIRKAMMAWYRSLAKDDDLLAVVARDLQAIRAPAGIASIDGDATIVAAFLATFAIALEQQTVHLHDPVDALRVGACAPGRVGLAAQQGVDATIAVGGKIGDECADIGDQFGIGQRRSPPWS